MAGGTSSKDSILEWINDDSASVESPPATLAFRVGSGAGVLVMEIEETGRWSVFHPFERSGPQVLEDTRSSPGVFLRFLDQGTPRLDLERVSTSVHRVKVSAGAGNALDLELNAEDHAVVRLDVSGRFTGTTTMELQDGAGAQVFRVSDYGKVNFNDPSTTAATLTFSEIPSTKTALLQIGDGSTRGILKIGNLPGSAPKAGILTLVDRLGALNYLWVSTETTLGKLRGDDSDPGTDDATGNVVGGLC